MSSGTHEIPESKGVVGPSLGEEEIARAAIKYGESVWWVGLPGRHHTIAHIYYKKNGRKIALETEEAAVQGFVTTKGRFVDRIEAVEIAMESGQIDKPQWPPHLYSEDLW